MSQPKYRRSSEALHSAIGDDVVALHVRHGHCYGMEKVTADVWRLLAEEKSLDQLSNLLKDIYDVDESTCREEVTSLIETMMAEGLVEVVSAGNSH